MTNRQTIIAQTAQHIINRDIIVSADSIRMNEIIEFIARKNNDTWQYYLSISDRQYSSIARAIVRNVKKH